MENFIVSARKYRPATFRSVVGQNHITATLQNAISRGQLAHAYLFCGPRGVGKTTCARIFAKAINCLNPREIADGAGVAAGAGVLEACGECESCRSFDEGRSFNIHELDAASNNSVEDIRSLTDQVRIPPQVGRYSVYIIDEVHMLSAAAFNAFLKTLEEPPAHAIFILATTEKHKIIPTILSRCQIFDFNRIRVADGVEYMKYIADTEGVKYDEESLNLIARKADGGMRDALSMLDKAVSFCGTELRYKDVAASLNILDYDTYFGAVDQVLAGDYAAALLMFDRVLSQGFSGQTFMAGLSSHLRDLLVAREPATAELLDVTGSLLDRYKAQAARSEVEFLFSGIALLTELDAKIRVATNQRLLVELALMKLCGLGGQNTVTKTVNLPETTKPEPVSAPVPVSVSAPKAEAAPSPAPEPAAKPTPEPTAVQKPETVSTPSFTGISGKPLAEIMNGSGGTTTAPTSEEAPSPIDPESQAKIEAGKAEFIAGLTAGRPRMAGAFETMQVEGNRVGVRVASEAQREELLRQRTELLQLLAKTAGVKGTIELEVTVDESIKTTKPIKVEDKLKHLTDQNPEINLFRKTLELELE